MYVAHTVQNIRDNDYCLEIPHIARERDEYLVQSVVSDVQIPIFYAIAMGVDALVALIIGKTYDKIGLVSLITIPVLTLSIAL